MHPSPAKTLLLALSLCLTTAAAAPPLGAQAGIPGSRGLEGRDRELQLFQEELRADLNGVLQRWRRAWGARDLDALVRLYTDDAYVALPGAELVRGRDEVRDALAAALEELRDLQLEVDEFEGCEALGFGGGPYSYTVQADGEARREIGSLVLVVHKRRDRWYIRSQIFRAAAPSSETVTR
ncbi:MAG TPA: nuclear transport factor 2 family protein [Gemmatimonadaceae bacterium]|nr:nuclear transport factor 2 family protein [Gemmatimonadaceae bacterium]